MVSTIGQVEIPLSKKKLLQMLIGSLAFVALGLWLVFNPPTNGRYAHANPIFAFVIGAISILFFAPAFIFIAKKLYENKPGLIIDNIGITDNSHGVSAGLIVWSDIEKIYEVQINKQKIIIIEVKNPQEYIDKQLSYLKRKLMLFGINMYGTPLSITSNTLQIKHDELVLILNNTLKAKQP
ncbi:MAG: STM3941 family protein [Bacteroidia bacterium]